MNSSVSSSYAYLVADSYAWNTPLSKLKPKSFYPTKILQKCL